MSTAPDLDVIAQDAAAAEALLAAGRIDEAIAFGARVVDSKSHDFQIWMWFGEMLLGAKRPAQAMSAFANASSLCPGHASSFTSLATLRFRLAYGGPPTPRAATGSA